MQKLKNAADLYVIFNFCDYEHTVPCCHINPCCWRALFESMKQAGFCERLFRDCYADEKRIIWDKADLNLFQYSRLCRILDFTPPAHWDRPNFCEVRVLLLTSFLVTVYFILVTIVAFTEKLRKIPHTQPVPYLSIVITSSTTLNPL